MEKLAAEGALSGLGLSGNEAKVYFALLRLKSALAGEITGASGVHRRNVYDSLERLREKGLASVTLRNNRRYYTAAAPTRLLDLALEREEKIRSALPFLEGMLGSSARGEAVLVYSGVAGYKTLFEDILSTLPQGSVWKAITAFHRISQPARPYLDFVHKRRVQKRIAIKALYNEDAASVMRGRELAKLSFATARKALLSDKTPAGLSVYGKKCALTLVAEHEEPIIVIFDNEFIARTFETFFDALWKGAKPLR